MERVLQRSYTPDLTGLPSHTTPDWDELKSQPVNPEADYQLLRRMQYLKPGQLAAFNARNYQLTFEVVIVTQADSTDEHVSHSRESLTYQGYDHLYVTVIAGELLANYLNGCQSEWVVLLYAGDTLTPHATMVMLDAIHANPEQRVFYTDEEVCKSAGTLAEPFFKPDLSLEWLRSTPYVGRSALFSIEHFRTLQIDKFVHTQLAAYQVVLHTVARGGRLVVGHIQEILYQSPLGFRSWVSQSELMSPILLLVKQHMIQSGIAATVDGGLLPGSVRVRYQHTTAPKVSILIPVRDQAAGLRRLVDGLMSRTKYINYEIVIVDGYSSQPVFQNYLLTLEKTYPQRVKVVFHKETFNYARLIDQAVQVSTGEYLAILHPDMQITQPDWLSVMLDYAQCMDVGVVGSTLVYPDGHLQHAGVILGMSGGAGHLHLKVRKDQPGYFGRLKTPQDLSAVTGAGSLISRTAYDAIGGFNQEDFPLIYHDVDLCLRMTQAGYRIVWTPYVTHMTDDNAVPALDNAHPSTRELRVKRSMIALRERAIPQLANDPYYHPHLSLTETQPSVAYRTSLSWSPFIQTALPRIVTFPGDKSGCGFYRTRGPLDGMVAEGMAEGMASEWMIPVIEMKRLRADTLVLQRKTADGQLQSMDDYRRYLKNTFRVYELDDLLHAIPPKSIHYGQFPKDILERTVRGMQLCDRVVVSTLPLADAFASYHHDIVIQKNRLIPRYWKSLNSVRHTGPVARVGWGGGSSHRGDLEMIADVIRHFKDRVTWVFFGMVPDLLRPYVKEFHPPVKIDVYPKMMASLHLDLALAPVEDNHFNACKSNLRVLEYGACGYPVIASDVAAYNTTGLPITLVNSDPKNWISAIEEHLEDRDRLYQRGQMLREAIHRDWMLEGQHLQNWLKAWTP